MKYRAIVQGNGVIVYNNTEGHNRVFHITAFIYGQVGYDPKTDKYPNYIHKQIWEQWEANR